MKVPKPPYSKALVAVEDATRPSHDRGWLIAKGRTPRIVEAHVVYADARAKVCVEAAKSLALPCTFLLTKGGKVANYKEGSYDIY